MIKDILNRAADLIQRNGLHKGRLTDKNTEVDKYDKRLHDDECARCVEGAIWKAMYDIVKTDSYDLFVKVLTVFRKTTGIHFLYMWNDSEVTTQDDVIKALRFSAQNA